MCSEPEIRAPANGATSRYSRRRAIRPGISCSASRISLRPNSASDRSATLKSKVPTRSTSRSTTAEDAVDMGIAPSGGLGAQRSRAPKGLDSFGGRTRDVPPIRRRSVSDRAVNRGLPCTGRTPAGGVHVVVQATTPARLAGHAQRCQAPQPQAPPQQPPPAPGAEAPPYPAAPEVPDRPARATVDSSLTVSRWPSGQPAGAADSFIGRCTSKRVPQSRQRNS